MIKTKQKNIKVPITKTIHDYEIKRIEEYICSDGTIFNNSEDHYNNYNKGKDRAESYQKRLDLITDAKDELKFTSIDSTINEGYENEFCFYYSEVLSSNAKLQLCNLVYDLCDLSKLRHGWHYVNQNVYEISSSSCNRSYNSNSVLEYLEDYIDVKQNKLNKLNDILISK